uniref:Symplekin n=1 Tax=Panagrolaimus superbus TaxID=310955 RepID=A0A914YRR3_9BILA
MAENVDQQISEDDPKEIYHFIGKQFSDAGAPDIDDPTKITYLTQAQDKIFAADDVGTVLDSFIDNFLSFFNSEENSIKIRIFTIKFIEKACRFDPSIVKKVAAQLHHSLSNLSDNSEIHKKIIIVVTQLYPFILQWIASRKSDIEAESAWESFSVLKGRIMQMVDSKNEGIRVLTMRFLETLVICQTTKSEMSDLSKLSYQMSLNQVGRDHRFISYRQLETEAAHSFKSLMDHLSSSRTTLLHLISTVTAVARIARARPEFMSQMVEAFESLLYNLPPTLGTGQVKSVRKELTNNLFRLLKHPAAFTKHLQRIQSLLHDLGASDVEIKRNMPDPAELSAALKKRVEANSAQKRTDLLLRGGPLSKKARIEEDEYDDQKSASAFDDQEAQNRAYQEATDMTTNWIMEKLQHGHIVSHLVYISLLSMPHEMPAAFSANTYGVPENVTPDVKRNVARMLATQFMREQKGPGAAYFSEIKKKQHLAKQKAKDEGVIIPPTPADLRDDKHVIKQPTKDDEGFAVPLLPSKTKKSVVKIDIYRETKEFSDKESRELRQLLFRRLLESEAQMNHPKQRQQLYKSLVYIVTRFFNDITPELEEQLLSFVITDQKRRGDTLMFWLTELYSQAKGINCCIKDSEDGFTFTEAEHNARYDTIMVNCLSRLFAQNEHKEALFHNIFLEAPVITPGALLILRKACVDPDSCSYSMATLRELILNRNRHRYDFLKIMLELSYVESDVVRHESIATTKELASIDYVYPEVREFIIRMCQNVTETTVPPLIWSAANDAMDRMETEEVQWNESYARAGLILALNMIPIDTSLIDILTHTLAKAPRLVKLFLINSLDKYATQLSQDDPNVLNAIDNCPNGGEAFIARCVVIMTAKTDPSTELVRRLKALQERYNSDIRSLIPIIPGLTKEECLDLVPKFVLNATNLRTVPMFYRKILRSPNLVTKKPPVTVPELIFKLHSIEHVSAKAITLLQNSIDILIVDQKNEFFEESDQIPGAITQLADLPVITPFVFHSIQKLYEKHQGLGDSLSKTLLKCVEKRPWESDPKAFEAFKECSKTMGGYAYSALLFGLPWEKFTELIEDQERDQLLGQKLKTYISTLPAHQQRKIDRRMIDFVKGELEKDDKKDKKKGINDPMVDTNWIQTHNLQSAFLAGGRREENEDEQNWLKEGVEEVIKAIDEEEEEKPNESQIMEEIEDKNEPKILMD